MHPAYSVLFFTTASGAGYGLLFWLSVLHLIGALPESRWLPFLAITLALVLITGGLLASTLHLGRPKRALRAFSQWRTSWLSREGVAAVATYAPAGLLALAWMFGIFNVLTGLLALLSAIGAVITVWCTGMIYASLRTIRQWNQPLVPVIYLALAAATGALLLALLLAMDGKGGAQCWTLAMCLLAGLGLKMGYFAAIDGAPGKYTVQMALGFTSGKVRPLDPPHTMPNFVMREMGYQVARKHAEQLRRLALILLFVMPLIATAIVLATGLAPVFLLICATGSAAVGVFVERWLFFAEAEHVAMLYYGKERA